MNIEQIFNILKEVADPEIPVLSVVDLGVIREVDIQSGKVVVTITPTYSGCPAMKVFEDDIKAKLLEYGYKDVTIKTVLSPSWTTDWMSNEAKEKLREYGIAPPEGNSADKNLLLGKTKLVPCPRCKSENTKMLSQFGSTACKSLYQCKDCLEPFDYFKCI